MDSFVSPGAGWNEQDLDVRVLDGPPPNGFDCGRQEQNEFLYERAWRDQRLMASVTRLFFVKGILAAYVTTLADSIELGTREKDKELRYRSIAALKIAQLAVDTSFGGSGLGRLLVSYVIQYARRVGPDMGFRYVTLDARPELEGWYATQGFVRNELVQKRKLEHARATGRDEEEVTISMRFDLLETSRT